MKKIENWEQVDQKLPAGCYALRIIDVEDVSDKEMLKVTLEIAEGEFKDYYKNNSKLCVNYRSYKPSAVKFFKQFIVAVEKSNPGYAWDWNEKSLIGKFCAGEFGEEEFINDNDEVKVMVRLQNFRSLQALREGKCVIPERKTVEHPAAPSAEDVSVVDNDDKLPF